MREIVLYPRYFYTSEAQTLKIEIHMRGRSLSGN